MDDAALHTLRTVFGYSEFRAPQDQVIRQLIDGNDAVVLMPTGGGKSLCFQIPAMVREGVGIVVSPLIALMQDQVSTLQQYGVRAAYANSTLSSEESRQVEQDLLHNRLDLLYVAPERLMTGRFLQLLQDSRLALFAIDEAHCVSQWGHDFRPEYIQLSVLHERFPKVPRIALTATADTPTRQEIIERLGLQQAQVFNSGVDRPNIRYRINQGQSNSRESLLRFIRSEHEDEAGIVYCLSRKRVDQIAAWLSEKGINALPYHAGLSTEVRQQHQQRFLQEDGVVVVATIAFGMGIDKPDVRFVAHLNLPKSLEAYYQETGRAGRDGLHADAWMSYGLQDVITLRQMLESSEADEVHKRVERHKLESMLGFAELTGCRRQALLKYFGEHRDQPCGNCDTCLTPVETWDASVVAQKALSCVHRTGQRFGVNYLIDVLLGKDNERIKNFGHHTLKVYGLGKELAATQWRSIFRQLIARDLLAVDLQGHGGLHLTEQCRSVLRGEQTLMLRKESESKKTSRSGREQRHFGNDSDRQLWEALRECRRRLAEQQGIPPYMVFHDATLMEILSQRPDTHQQLAMISGVGERKLANFGDAFLQVVRQHGADAPAAPQDDSSEQTWQLFRCGMDVDAIARQRELKPVTVYSHLATKIADGDLQLEQVIDLEQRQVKTILDTLLDVGKDGKHLKPVYDALGGAYDYGVLRCVSASLRAKEKF